MDSLTCSSIDYSRCSANSIPSIHTDADAHAEWRRIDYSDTDADSSPDFTCRTPDRNTAAYTYTDADAFAYPHTDSYPDLYTDTGADTDTGTTTKWRWCR